MNEVVNQFADLVLLASFPAILLFVLFYLRSRWRTYAVGRALMHQAISLCLVVFIVLLSLILGSDYPGRPFVRLVGYTVLCAAMWRMLWVLVKIQRQGAREGHPMRRQGDAPHPLRRHDDPPNLPDDF